MSNVVVATFVTVDGVMEDPGGSEGFEHGGWQLPFFDQDMADGVRDGLFAAWPSMTDEDGFAERMTALPKYVASTTLKEPLAWNTALLDGDVPAAVAKLKQQPGGDLLVQGSGTLVRTLMRRNLVDTYQLWVHPVVLGSGKRLFADGVAPASLQLVDTKTTSTGVVALTYQTAGTAEEG